MLSAVVADGANDDCRSPLGTDTHQLVSASKSAAKEETGLNHPPRKREAGQEPCDAKRITSGDGWDGTA